MIIYLYRWEWNRAIISGVFFVAAEVALATSMILRRLRPSRGAKAPQPSEASPPVLERIRATPFERPNPFGWLTPPGGTLGVFVR